MITENLDWAKNFKVWHVDGTFDCAPKLYTQMFTLQVVERGKFFRFPAKNPKNAVSRSSQWHTGELYGIKLHCDYEKGIWNGFNEHFGKKIDKKNKKVFYSN